MNRRNFIKGLFATVAVASIPQLPLPVITPETKFVSFEEMIATTLKEYSEIISKNFFQPNPIWLKLTKDGLINVNS